MHRCWFCNNELNPVYFSMTTVFIQGLGYVVKTGGPVKWTCLNKACRNYMQGTYQREVSTPNEALHLQEVR